MHFNCKRIPVRGRGLYSMSAVFSYDEESLFAPYKRYGLILDLVGGTNVVDEHDKYKPVVIGPALSAVFLTALSCDVVHFTH